MIRGGFQAACPVARRSDPCTWPPPPPEVGKRALEPPQASQDDVGELAYRDLMSEDGNTVYTDAIVEFTDGALAKFTTAEILPNRTLRVTYTDTLYVDAGYDGDNEHKEVTVTDTATYNKGVWRSVNPPKRGVLMVGIWGKNHDGQDYHTRHHVEADVTADEAREHAKKWLSNYLTPQEVERKKHLFSTYIELDDRLKRTVRFFMHWPHGTSEDIDIALETRAQINAPHWRTGPDSTPE
ncbi:Uncharacterised protein [Mycobacteroides abscessus subsp. abscessus]|nr:Uncharacterised protein [Mycobacteroides abscessus subsp. bolletii]SII91559.1 Uncharacterised protein [Mycobacteroides abscessus subsp. abscessus]SIK06533.1 Uncharacterised protein [Mycobacteroides abscessus subsp. abscessus]SIK11107.1 Uncharacterised protein [Mycobacteroides abscessus subsp. abscessus]SIM11041.1 Uncharacterised protein [Mycobacteroides abscessus subsp. abscessus]